MDGPCLQEDVEDTTNPSSTTNNSSIISSLPPLVSTVALAGVAAHPVADPKTRAAHITKVARSAAGAEAASSPDDSVPLRRSSPLTQIMISTRPTRSLLRYVTDFSFVPLDVSLYCTV